MDIIKFKEESEKICYYCGKKITKKDDLTVDHIIPVSKGGKTARDNLVIACKSCNAEKSNLDVSKYLEFVNIMKTMEETNTNDTVSKIITGLKNIIQNFNTEMNNVKKRINILEKKRSAVLQSMMYKKFNVIQGYDYAKTLRDLTEEIFNLRLTSTQMMEIYAKINSLNPFLSDSAPDNIKKKAVKQIRDRTINDYYILGIPSESEDDNKTEPQESPEEEQTAE